MRKDRIAFILCFAGIAVVYLTHLGKISVHADADECRRALVAMEMHISGDYLAPTLNGESYLNKPPLYSWIVAASFSLFGQYSSFALRFPVVISILLLGLVIFFFVRKYCGDGVAAISALAFMTNGRTLIFDSLLGLLEHSLALQIYTGFMLIFLLGEKQRFYLLFAVSYFLAALGLLLKGLPSLAHQGIALIVYFGMTRNWKKLFSAEHVLGLGVFIGTLALYYIPFLLAEDVSLTQVIQSLLHESSKRYEFHGMADFIYVLADYPVDFIYHFLPWTVLILVLFQKKIRSFLIENKFIFYNLLLFLANTPFYWLASLKNPHYLYFLIPLLYTVLIFIYFKTAETDRRRNIIEWILNASIGLAVIGAIWIPFSGVVQNVPALWLKSIFFMLSFGMLFLSFIKWKSWRLYLFTGALILIRLGFNWFVLPQRLADGDIYKDRADKVNAIVQDSALYIMASYPAGYYDRITFYMEKYRNEILRVRKDVDYDAFYLVDDVYLHAHPGTILLEFPFEYADNNLRFAKEMYLVRFTH